MKKYIIFGLMTFSFLMLTSCSDTTSNTETQVSMTSTSTLSTSSDKDMSGMNHSTMDMPSNSSMNHMQISTEEEFIAKMIPHHQEAVDTASIIVAKTQNMELKKIAEEIVSLQKNEITLLNSWMKTWYPNSNITGDYMKMMRDFSGLSDHDLDDGFMQDMIKHHEGAIFMANAVLEVSQRPEIVKMANDIIRAQSAEIAKFKELLSNH